MIPPKKFFSPRHKGLLTYNPFGHHLRKNFFSPCHKGLYINIPLRHHSGGKKIFFCLVIKGC